MTDQPKLTPTQLEELKRLAERTQSSQGKGRVRVHNNLRRLGFVTIHGSRHGFECSITAVGRAFLKGLPEKRDTWVRGVLLISPTGYVSVGGAMLSGLFKEFDGKKVRVKLEVIE